MNSSPPTLVVWSLPGHGHIVTRAFAKRHVAVSLPDRTVLQASPADVLGAGRGKHLDHHPGNLRLTALIDTYKTAYHNGTSTTKRDIIKNRILNTLQNENRRVLRLKPYQRDANIWYWIEEPKSRSKIGQKLRDAYKSSWAKKKHFGSPPGDQHHLTYPITMMPTPSNNSKSSTQHHGFQAYPSRTVQEVHAEGQPNSGVGTSSQGLTGPARVTPWIAVATDRSDRTSAPPAFNLVGSFESLKTNNDESEAPKPNMPVLISFPTGDTPPSCRAPNYPRVGTETTLELYNKSGPRASHPSLTNMQTSGSLSELPAVSSLDSAEHVTIASCHLHESIDLFSDFDPHASLLEHQFLDFDAFFGASEASLDAGSTTVIGNDKSSNCFLPEQQQMNASHNAVTQSGIKSDDPHDFTNPLPVSARLFAEVSIIPYNPHSITSWTL